MSSEKHPEGDVGNREAAAADREGSFKGPDVRVMSGSLAVLFPPAEDGPSLDTFTNDEIRGLARLCREFPDTMRKGVLGPSVKLTKPRRARKP
jgi:hypothetical protein